MTVYIQHGGNQRVSLVYFHCSAGWICEHPCIYTHNSHPKTSPGFASDAVFHRRDEVSGGQRRTTMRRGYIISHYRCKRALIVASFSLKVKSAFYLASRLSRAESVCAIMSAMNEQYVCKMCVKQSIKQGPRHSLSPQSITEVWEEQSEWERPAFDQSLTTLYYREITITHRGGGGGGRQWEAHHPIWNRKKTCMRK